MFTIGQVAKKYSLSRSTLIYYDNIGVLSPRGRSESNYRLYSESDLKKMDRIQLFRSAGLSLDSIEQLLEKENSELDSTLEGRLLNINSEIQKLRNQQKVILNILENESLAMDSRLMTKEVWVSILRAAGLDDAGMKNWHIEFERTSPEAHQDFLESLGIEKNEVAAIRDWSRPEN
ncbi:MAG: MerR family transcriptional regulator [Xanthomonadales bacterium]|nr:MerR family transcriptional regulator [Xanthomonadales bacterium]MDH4018690.1 MerR family transcriptional regulator [Xanthomonadales bacterium]